MANITAAAWSTDAANLGTTVTLTAALANIITPVTIPFVISEYIAQPITAGGGYRIRQIATLTSDVQQEAQAASVNWIVALVADGLGKEGIPQYRFSASLPDGSNTHSSLLSIGSITEVTWLPPTNSETPQPTTDAIAQTSFSGQEKVGLTMVGQGLEGFKATFKIYRRYDKPGGTGQSEYKLVDTIPGVPVVDGVARTEWGIEEGRLPELSPGQFRFSVDIGHPSLPNVPMQATTASTSTVACNLESPELFFAIYYVNEIRDAPHAFERASITWEKFDIGHPGQAGYDPRTRVVRLPVTTESDFKMAWEEIYRIATTASPPYKIRQGRIYSHSDKETGMGQEYGLLFAADGSGDITNAILTRNETMGLRILPWDKRRGSLYLHGCNTGTVGQRGWCPAEVFAKRQGVRTYGEDGYATFSRTPFFKNTISDNPTELAVYLAAFNYGVNLRALGVLLLARIPLKMFLPD